MAVIVQYIVEKNGIVKMTFDNKKEAEAYDKVLDIAANMWAFLEKSKIGVEENLMEELCMYIATNKDQSMAILKGIAAKDGASSPAKEKSPTTSGKTTDKTAVKSTDNKSAKTNKGKKQVA